MTHAGNFGALPEMRVVRNQNARRWETKQAINLLRPPVRYYGAKWRLAPWITKQFPTHNCYVEPFCGGAGVFWRKQPVKFEVLNDLNHDIVTFFDVLRSRPDELIAVIKMTPHSRYEHKRAYVSVSRDDPLEVARRFFIRCWQSFGSGEGKWNTGWRYQAHDRRGGASANKEWRDVDRLYEAAQRLLQVQIECDDASKIIRRYDTARTLFYVDPPYLFSTRYSNEQRYSHEMSENDHRALSELLHSVDGMVVLSGYPSALYDELYADWTQVEKSAKTNANHDSTECLWLSPNTLKKQLPMMQYLAEMEGASGAI